MLLYMQQRADGAGSGRTLRVHPADGSTFLREMTA